MADDLPSFSILSRDHVRAVLRKAARHNPTKHIPYLVSVSDPEDGPPPEVEKHAGRTLMLCFHDVCEPDEDLTMPDPSDVRQIIEFAKDIAAGEHVVCHCNAGISRSSASAATILAAKLEPTKENALRVFEELVEVKKVIRPNRRMIQYADELLGYNGHLLGAYRKIFGQGTEFIWLLK